MWFLLSSLPAAAALPDFSLYCEKPPNANFPVGQPAHQSAVSPWLEVSEALVLGSPPPPAIDPSLPAPASWRGGAFLTFLFGGMSRAGIGCLGRERHLPNVLVERTASLWLWTR